VLHGSFSGMLIMFCVLFRSPYSLLLLPIDKTCCRVFHTIPALQAQPWLLSSYAHFPFQTRNLQIQDGCLMVRILTCPPAIIQPTRMTIPLTNPSQVELFGLHISTSLCSSVTVYSTKPSQRARHSAHGWDICRPKDPISYRSFLP
jgi:hypothetical protein